MMAETEISYTTGLLTGLRSRAKYWAVINRRTWPYTMSRNEPPLAPTSVSTAPQHAIAEQVKLGWPCHYFRALRMRDVVERNKAGLHFRTVDIERSTGAGADSCAGSRCALALMRQIPGAPATHPLQPKRRDRLVVSVSTPRLRASLCGSAGLRSTPQPQHRRAATKMSGPATGAAASHAATKAASKWQQFMNHPAGPK